MSIEIMAFGISGATFLGGIVAWHSANVQKKYAAQRDFEHLKRNYQQMTENLAAIGREMDERFDGLDRSNEDIRRKVDIIMIKILPEQSAGWGKNTEG